MIATIPELSDFGIMVGTEVHTNLLNVYSIHKHNSSFLIRLGFALLGCVNDEFSFPRSVLVGPTL